MIEVRSVTKKFDDFTAIEDISCRIKKGSIYGLVGYNGSGKTTLLKTICGIYRPEKGIATLDDRNIYDNPDAKSRIFFVSDDPYMLPQASMKTMARFYKGYYRNWNEKVFEKLVEIFRLDPGKRMSGFSKGMQRQAFIIFALSVSPEYLILDESFDGIDPVMRDLVRQLLLESILERDLGIIISSHNLRELEDLCDRVGVINGKKIVFETNIDDMRISKNKFKIVLNGDPDDEQFALDMVELGISFKNLKRDGRIISFIADGLADEITIKLEKICPLMLETIPLTLEEIFLIEMEAQTYDFSNLFG